MDYDQKLLHEAGWENFSYGGDRLWCRCDSCQKMGDEWRINQIPDGLIELIDDSIQPMRTSLRFSFGITSGHRCHLHPDEVNKMNPGPHQYGAIDIGVSHLYASRLLGKSYGNSYITGRGINQRGDVDRRFIHFDSLGEKPWRPRPHIWTY